MKWSSLSDELAPRLPDNTAIDVREIDDHVRSLFPAELDAIAGAVPGRRREFSTGRACARGVLRALGHPPQAIPVGDRREPRWPTGVQGAITHDAGLCIAIGREPDEIATLGVDLTGPEPLDHSLRNIVCTRSEAARLASAPKAERIDPFKIVLSAKESVYKVLFPLVQRYVDFQDVSVELEFGKARWSVNLIDPGLRDHISHPIEGRFLVTDKFIVTTAWSRVTDRFSDAR